MAGNTNWDAAPGYSEDLTRERRLGFGGEREIDGWRFAAAKGLGFGAEPLKVTFPVIFVPDGPACKVTAAQKRKMAARKMEASLIPI